MNIDRTSRRDTGAARLPKIGNTNRAGRANHAPEELTSTRSAVYLSQTSPAGCPPVSQAGPQLPALPGGGRSTRSTRAAADAPFGFGAWSSGLSGTTGGQPRFVRASPGLGGVLTAVRLLA